MGDISSRPVLVTGGTGFLAGHTILQMLHRGHAVRATVRSMARAEGLRRSLAASGADITRLEIAEADLMRAETWPEALAGTGAVLHMATPMAGPDVEVAAVDGTRHILDAAARAGVSRILVTSTGLAAAPVQSSSVTEADWSEPDHPATTRYAAAKTRAERLAWDMAARLGLGLTTILPGVILGPAFGPDRPAWLGLIHSMLHGKVPALPPVSLQLVDVRDLAALHIEALMQPAAIGQRYLAANQTLSLRDIAHILQSRPEGYRVSARQLPVWLFGLLARVSADMGALYALRRAPKLDTSKAMTELKWQPRPARETVLDAAASVAS
jgi:dihydroflavonol-4-reductase